MNIFLLTVLTVLPPGETFLLIPPSARASGMGYAQTAYCFDASANYYNAACMLFVERVKITIDAFQYLSGLDPDLYYVYIAGIMPFGNSAIGLDFTLMSLGRVEVRNFAGDYLGEYYCFKNEGKISYSRIILPGFAAGLGVKVINQNHRFGSDPGVLQQPLCPGLELSGRGTWLAFDVNSAYKINPRLYLGMVVHDLGPNIKYEDIKRENSLPTTWHLAISFAPIKNPNYSLTLSGEITKILPGMFNGSGSFWDKTNYEIKSAWKGIGAEVGFREVIFMRAGYFYDYEWVRKGITFGAGIRLFKFDFDVGVDENIFEFSTSQKKFSLSYTF